MDHAIVSLWMSLSELSIAKGIGKPALSERVSRLEKQGLITTRPGKGRQKLINVAEFDRAVGQVTNLARALGLATRRRDDDEFSEEAPVTASAIYLREQAKRMSYIADIAGLEVAVRRGELVEVVEVKNAITTAGQKCAKLIDNITQEDERLRKIAHRGDACDFESALRIISARIATEAMTALSSIINGRNTPQA